jgi:hypothetical protein
VIQGRRGGTVTYDTGALIAADNGSRRMWQLHERMLRRRRQPVVPAVVLAQAWRGGPQHRLSRLLRACVVEPLTEDGARQAGRLLGRAGGNDVVDAVVALAAAARRDLVVTSDPDDLAALAAALRVDLELERV